MLSERVERFKDKKRTKTPWITVGILSAINQRNRLYKIL